MQFADNAPASADLLGHLVLEYFAVLTYNIKNYKYWTHAPRTHAYAFLEVATEEQGQLLIDNNHHITLEHDELYAEWTTDSKCNIVRNLLRLSTRDHPHFGSTTTLNMG